MSVPYYLLYSMLVAPVHGACIPTTARKRGRLCLCPWAASSTSLSLFRIFIFSCLTSVLCERTAIERVRVSCRETDSFQGSRKFHHISGWSFQHLLGGGKGENGTHKSQTIPCVGGNMDCAAFFCCDWYYFTMGEGGGVPAYINTWFYVVKWYKWGFVLELKVIKWV